MSEIKRGIRDRGEAKATAAAPAAGSQARAFPGPGFTGAIP
jgi:hypothetical protein